MYPQNQIAINNETINYWRITNTASGNPRYVIHFLDVSDSYNEALNISRQIGGKAYRAKWFGGGIVISSYNLESDLKRIIK